LEETASQQNKDWIASLLNQKAPLSGFSALATQQGEDLVAEQVRDAAHCDQGYEESFQEDVACHVSIPRLSKDYYFH
jgi:hypothetical protein